MTIVPHPQRPPEDPTNLLFMLSNSKVAFALICLLAVTVDALRSPSPVKVGGRMFYEKRNLPPVKRDVPAQLVAVCSTLLNGPRGLEWLIPLPSSLSITGVTQEPSTTGTGIMQRTINKAVPFSVRYRCTPCNPPLTLMQSMTLERPTLRDPPTFLP